MAEADECRQLFHGTHRDDNLWKSIRDSKAKCECERHSVGDGTIGAVAGHEVAIRLLTIRDFDPILNKVAATAFRSTFKNGLSALRGGAPDEDVVNTAIEMMAHKDPAYPQQVRGALAASVSDIRDLKDGAGDQIFGVYDQTVPRRDFDIPIPSHIGIFGTRPLRGEKGKPPITPLDQLIKEYTQNLFELFCQTQTVVGEFRGGLLVQVNERASLGEFCLAATNDDLPGA